MGEANSDEWTSPIYIAGKLRFYVTADEFVAPRVAVVFDALGIADGDQEAVRFCVERNADETSWTVRGPNCPTRKFGDIDGLVDSLVAAVTISALDSDPDALHLHAAAASCDGEAVIIVGTSGSGKSTLVANLARSGWRYMTDEMVRIEADPEFVSGFAKPISISPKALDLISVNEIAPQTSTSGVSLQLSPSSLGFELADIGRSRLLLCAGPAVGRRGETPTASELHAADAVVQLMGQTMDAQRFGSDALEVLARLAARCSCFELVVGEPKQLIALVDELMKNAVDNAVDSAVPVQMATASGRIAANVRTAFLGDRAVVHEPTTGVIAAFDQPACAIWRRLGEMPGFDSSIDLDGPVEARFVENLEAMGLVGEYR